MVLDERARHELFLRLEAALGSESAETLMEMLPPVGWADVATKRDLDALEDRMALRFDLVDRRFEMIDQRFEMVDQRFEAIDQRFEAVDQRFEALDQRLGSLDQRLGSMDQQFGSMDQQLGSLDQQFGSLEHKLIATFRGELLAQSNVISGQMRTLVMANIGTVLSVAALTFGAVKLT
jgi:chromosome segregation ATPase